MLEFLTAPCCRVQFQTDARDTETALKRLDTELNQKYNPDLKDQYQLKALLRDLNVNISCTLSQFSFPVYTKYCLYLSVF